jgi:hypothetical protein
MESENQKLPQIRLEIGTHIISSMDEMSKAKFSTWENNVASAMLLYGTVETRNGQQVHCIVSKDGKLIPISQLLLDQKFKGSTYYMAMVHEGTITTNVDDFKAKVEAVENVMNGNPDEAFRVLRTIYPARKELSEQNLTEMVKKEMVIKELLQF